MEGIDFTFIYTTIGGVLGTPASIADKLNFYGQIKQRNSHMPYNRQIPDAPIVGH